VAESKYSQYVNQEWITKSVFNEVPAPQWLISGAQHLDGYPFSAGWSCLTEPFTMVPGSHSHDYDQIIGFTGGNSGISALSLNSDLVRKKKSRLLHNRHLSGYRKDFPTGH